MGFPHAALSVISPLSDFGGCLFPLGGGGGGRVRAVAMLSGDWVV